MPLGVTVAIEEVVAGGMANGVAPPVDVAAEGDDGVDEEELVVDAYRRAIKDVGGVRSQAGVGRRADLRQGGGRIYNPLVQAVVALRHNGRLGRIVAGEERIAGRIGGSPEARTAEELRVLGVGIDQGRP